MGKCVDYKEFTKGKNLWVPDSQLSHIPGVIIKEYELLYESIEKDDVCGALFRLKDLYETCMKQPAILAIISISSYIEDDNDFIRMTSEELKVEYEKYISNQSAANLESEALQKYGLVLSRLLREPLSIGSWKELIEIICEYADIFELDENLKSILQRTLKLLSVRPKKVNGENGRYEDVSNWRNKTIGHGTLQIRTEDYWEQVYDLVQGLQAYFIGENGEPSLSELYRVISLEKSKENNQLQLKIGAKKYSTSEFIYCLEDGQYFFDSYYSRQRYTEITNYVSAPIRLKNSVYYHTLYSLFSAIRKSGTRKKGRQVATSKDREMYSCLKNIPLYEKPEFVISEIKRFMDQNNKGVLYIQMERGMGKSTLAHKVDGRYQKELLQKDLNAIVRVYHVSDMQLRGENRRRDFFTALNNNLLSFCGGQLEVDNEEYYVEDGDLRQLVEGEGESASIAFCQYLELFRNRYEEEIDEVQERETKLIYIIDGIDELNSDTFSVINTIPDGRKMQSLSDDLVDNVYIVLFSRTKDEDDLPLIAKESISTCEDKANFIYKIDNENEKYYQLLIKFIKRNFRGLSENRIVEIIENAQRKFLYIHPYMAMGESILTPGAKISAYDVAKKYINELQKLYCGTSLHTLQLIISSIAMFHVVSLKEICNLILFTKVSYDVIGVLNDILPLLTTKRTDGEDMYVFANEEYERYVYENMNKSVCEAICRYRISITSWFESSDIKEIDFGKQWGNYIRRALVVDRVARKLDFFETTEEYIRTLINLYGRRDPGTFYSTSVNKELEANIIDQLRLTKYRDLELLSLKDLQCINLRFQARDSWDEEDLNRKRYEFTQEIIEHCAHYGKIDKWFEFVVSDKIGLESEYESDNHRLNAFRIIVEAWTNQEIVIDYLNQKIQDDLNENKYYTYGAYLEQLLSFVIGERLRKKIFVGLLNAYYLLAKKIIMFPRKNNVEEKRKEVMQKYLLEAETYLSLCNYSLIAEIKDAIFGENTYDKAIEQLNMLAESVYSNNSEEYSQELNRLRLTEENLTEDQVKRYRQAQINNYQSIINHIKKLLDEHSIDSVYRWLSACLCGDIKSFTVEDEGLLIEYLCLYEKLIIVCVEEGNIRKLSDLSWAFKEFLIQYDEKVRKKSIGLYRNRYWDVPVDRNQEMSSWERTYALYCSSLNDIDIRNLHDVIPVVANDFTNKYLQELYVNGNFEPYNKLNCRIMETYENIEFRKNYILSYEYPPYRLIRNYYRWLAIRYFRSVEGKDILSSDLLYERLEEEYVALLNRVREVLSNESDLIHKGDMLLEVRVLIKELLCLSKMVPESICTVEYTKNEIASMIDVLVKTTSSNNEVKGLAGKINDVISEPSEWFNADAEFILDLADKSLFESFYGE